MLRPVGSVPLGTGVGWSIGGVVRPLGQRYQESDSTARSVHPATEQLPRVTLTVPRNGKGHTVKRWFLSLSPLGRALVILALAVVVPCVGCGSAMAVLNPSRSPAQPRTVNSTVPTSAQSPTAAPSPAPADTTASQAVPTAAPPPAQPPPPPPPPAVAPTTEAPAPPDDAGTPTLTGIRAGEFCKRALAGTYAYDSHGNLLYCGPPGATHPRWSHA